MKTVFTFFFLLIGNFLFGQEIPEILNGFDHQVEYLTTNDGVDFTAYLVDYQHEGFDDFLQLVKDNTAFVEEELDKGSGRLEEWVIFETRVDQDYEYLISTTAQNKKVVLFWEL